MRSAAAAALALALAFAPAALAQDPPMPPPPAPPAPPPAPAPKPPAAGEGDKPAVPAVPAAPAKHVNKVSAEAQAAYDNMKKVTYNPVALGLKDLKGTMVMKIEMAGQEGGEGMEGMPEMTATFTIDFKAPRTLVVDGTTDNPMLGQAVDQMKKQVQQLFLYGTGTMEPAPDAEYDAEVVTEKGAKVLVLKLYEKNESKGEMRMTLDANGLIGKGSMTQMDPNMGMEQTIEMSYQFSKDGDMYRMEKVTISHPMLPEPMETVMSYTDVGTFKVLTSIKSGGPMGMSFGFKYTDLTVNGKKVELPKPAPKKEEAKPAAPPTATPPAGDGGKAPEKKPDEPKPGDK
jgi:hypothetical protein